MEIGRRLRSAFATLAPDRLAKHRRIATPYLTRVPKPKVPARGGGLVFTGEDMWMFSPQNEPWFAELQEAPNSHRVSLGITLLARLAAKGRNGFDAFVIPSIIRGLAKSVPAHDRENRKLVVQLAIPALRGNASLEAASYAAAVVERAINDGTRVTEVEAELRSLIDGITKSGATTGDLGPLRARLLRLIGQRVDERQLFDAGDTWGAEMQTYFRSTPRVRDHGALLLHLASAASVSPTKKWNQTVRPMLEQDGAEELIRKLVEASLDSRLTRGPQMQFVDASPFQPANAALVRGAYWAAAAGNWAWVAETLGRAGLEWA
ncbi:MAG: hypothetical protein ACREMY_03670, partial [bacterium]